MACWSVSECVTQSGWTTGEHKHTLSLSLHCEFYIQVRMAWIDSHRQVRSGHTFTLALQVLGSRVVVAHQHLPRPKYMEEPRAWCCVPLAAHSTVSQQGETSERRQGSRTGTGWICQCLWEGWHAKFWCCCLTLFTGCSLQSCGMSEGRHG